MFNNYYFLAIIMSL